MTRKINCNWEDSPKNDWLIKNSKAKAEYIRMREESRETREIAAICKIRIEKAKVYAKKHSVAVVTATQKPKDIDGVSFEDFQSIRKKMLKRLRLLENYP